LDSNEDIQKILDCIERTGFDYKETLLLVLYANQSTLLVVVSSSDATDIVALSHLVFCMSVLISCIPLNNNFVGHTPSSGQYRF